MMLVDTARLEAIRNNPIENGLDVFRASFKSTCEKKSLATTPDSLGELDHDVLRDVALDLLLALQTLPVSRALRSKTGEKPILADLSRLTSTLFSDDFDFDRIKPLLNAALAESSHDARIWNEVDDAVTETTPPPRPVASSVQQTPWVHSTGAFVNSSEHRRYVDSILRQELGSLHVGLPGFHDAFFGRVPGLKEASEAVFERCINGGDPLYRQGWNGWPQDANQDDVLSWFADVIKKLAAFANGVATPPPHRRRLLAQPNKPIQGSTAERKLDVGFVTSASAQKDSRFYWSQIMVPGELKSNPAADVLSRAWLDLGTYAREVLAAQDTRRYVLGFTLCGSLMRIWEFDRLGGVASERFDINRDGLKFVHTILGFLWMSEEDLGFDPTIKKDGGQRFIEIERNGSTERLIIEDVMIRARCIAGRATTCWKAHPDGEPQVPLVIKDSWQYTERDHEGELLRETTNKGVINVARYYHHEDVCIRGMTDDIRVNVRQNLDVTKAQNYQSYRAERSGSLPGFNTKELVQRDRSSRAGTKRSSSQSGAPLPPSKRSGSVSPTKRSGNALLAGARLPLSETEGLVSMTRPSGDTLPNRIHRRVVVRDYGHPIYKASSRLALLTALEGCIAGHRSLREAGILHRDISVNNLMLNENDENPSWPSFLIDLDLAITEQRELSTGSQGKTGTRAFMAIGALLDEQHSFMHDLESFFWVLYWICIHYNSPGERSRTVAKFDMWNYMDTEPLAESKLAQVAIEEHFLRVAEAHFTPYFQPLIPWVNRLRRIVFPKGNPWREPEPELYTWMKEVLQQARDDPEVIAM